MLSTCGQLWAKYEEVAYVVAHAELNNRELLQAMTVVRLPIAHQHFPHLIPNRYRTRCFALRKFANFVDVYTHFIQ